MKIVISLLIFLGITSTAHAAVTQFFIHSTTTPGCANIRSDGLIWSSSSACGSGGGSGGTGWASSTDPTSIQFTGSNIVQIGTTTAVNGKLTVASTTPDALAPSFISNDIGAAVGDWINGDTIQYRAYAQRQTNGITWYTYATTSDTETITDSLTQSPVVDTSGTNITVLTSIYFCRNYNNAGFVEHALVGNSDSVTDLQGSIGGVAWSAGCNPYPSPYEISDFFGYSASTGLLYSAYLTNGFAYFGDRLGIGSTSPYSRFAIHANPTDAYLATLFSIASSTGTFSTSTLFAILANGNVGIGTTTPYAPLSVVGVGGIVAAKINATSTTASSTFIGIDASRVCITGTTTCLATSAGGSGTVGSGLTGEFGWYASNGTTISASSSDSLTIGRIFATSTATSTVAGPFGNIARIGVSSYSSLQHAFNIGNSAGLTSGGAFATSSASISVAAGTGLIKAADTDFSPLSFHDWVASSTLNVAATSTRFVGLEYNAGTPRVYSTTTEGWDLDTQYETGIAVREWDKISAVQFSSGSQDALSNIKERFQSICRVCIDTRLSGLVISNTGTRNLAITAGGLLSELDEYTFNAFNSSASQVFDYYYRNGSGGWVKTVNNSQWDNAKYDDGSGTLASVTALQYASAWIYAMTDGTVAILYGQTVNATPSIIFDEGSPATVPDRIKYMGILIGRFVFAGSGATPTRTISYTTALPASSNVQNHSELGGLAWTSAGHTGTASTFAGFDGSGVATNYTELNYLLAAGTRTLTGNWNVGNFDILGMDSASSTSFSSLNALYIGRTATTTINGDSATSTFSFKIAATSASTTATSTTAGINVPYEGCVAVRGVCLTTNAGTVTSITAGSGLTGGTITTSGTITLDLTNPNIWTGLQTFNSASSTSFSALNSVQVGRTATTTINGDTATSTFSAGATFTKIGTTATSSMAGLTLLTQGLTISTLPGCNGNFVLETDATGGVTCGADASGSGGGTFPFTAVAGGNATSTLLYLYSGLYSLGSTTIQFASSTAITVSGELVAPTSASPNPITSGSIIVNTATASSSIGVNNGTDKIRIYGMFMPPINIVLGMRNGALNPGTGTTTLFETPVPQKFRLDTVICKSRAGTSDFYLQIASTSLGAAIQTIPCRQATTTTAITSNNLYEAGQGFYVYVNATSTAFSDGFILPIGPYLQ